MLSTLNLCCAVDKKPLWMSASYTMLQVGGLDECLDAIENLKVTHLDTDKVNHEDKEHNRGK